MKRTLCLVLLCFLLAVPALAASHTVTEEELGDIMTLSDYTREDLISLDSGDFRTLFTFPSGTTVTPCSGVRLEINTARNSSGSLIPDPGTFQPIEAGGRLMSDDDIGYWAVRVTVEVAGSKQTKETMHFFHVTRRSNDTNSSDASNLQNAKPTPKTISNSSGSPFVTFSNVVMEEELPLAAYEDDGEKEVDGKRVTVYYILANSSVTPTKGITNTFTMMRKNASGRLEKDGSPGLPAIGERKMGLGDAGYWKVTSEDEHTKLENYFRVVSAAEAVTYQKKAEEAAKAEAEAKAKAEAEAKAKAEAEAKAKAEAEAKAKAEAEAKAKAEAEAKAAAEAQYSAANPPKAKNAAAQSADWWAIQEIDKAIDSQLLPASLQSGYTDNITRQEFCQLVMTLIARSHNKGLDEYLNETLAADLTSPFPDTSDRAVIAAQRAQIVSGRSGLMEGKFDPDGSITRQEAAKMLAMTAKSLNRDISAQSGAAFSDSAKIADWAKDFVNYVSTVKDPATGKVVMGGKDVSGQDVPIFDPEGAYTREQAALTVYRLYQAIHS